MVSVRNASDFAFLARLRVTAEDEDDVGSFLYVCEGMADAQERDELVGPGKGQVSELCLTIFISYSVIPLVLSSSLVV